MADPKIAINLTLQHEGLFQNDFNDHANWSSGKIGIGTLIGTKYGITALDMPGEDIRNLTLERAIAYYLEHYWKQGYSQIQSQDIASKLFDLGVLFGVGTAVGMLQHTLHVTEDNEFGPETLEHVNSTDPVSLLAEYKYRFVGHATQVGAVNPAEREFVAGWIRRINS